MYLIHDSRQNTSKNVNKMNVTKSAGKKQILQHLAIATSHKSASFNLPQIPTKCSASFVPRNLFSTRRFPKIGGKPPKMDGENNGKPDFQMDNLGKTHFFRKHPY